MSADNQPGRQQVLLTRRQVLFGGGAIAVGTLACAAASEAIKPVATVARLLTPTPTDQPEATATAEPTMETDPWRKYEDLAKQVLGQNPDVEAPQWDELTAETQSRVKHLVGYALTDDGTDPHNVGLNPVGRMALPENVFASVQTLTTPDNQTVTRVQLVVKAANDPEGSIQPGDMVYLRPSTENAQHPNHSLVRTTQEGTHIGWVVTDQHDNFSVVPCEVDTTGRIIRTASDEDGSSFNQILGALPVSTGGAGGPESTVDVTTDASGIATSGAIRFTDSQNGPADVALRAESFNTPSGEQGFKLVAPDNTVIAVKEGKMPWKFAEALQSETEAPQTIGERINAFMSGELIVAEEDIFRLDSQHTDRIEPFGQVIRHPVPNDGLGGSVSEHAEVQVVTLGMELVENVAVLYAGIYEPGTTQPKGVVAFTPGFAVLPNGYSPILEGDIVDVQQINQNPPIWYPTTTQATSWDQKVAGLSDLVTNNELVGRGSIIQYPVNTYEKSENEMVGKWGPSGFSPDELKWAFRVSQNEQLTRWMEGRSPKPDCVIDAGNIASLDQFRADIPSKVLPDITVWRIPAKPDPVRSS